MFVIDYILGSLYRIAFILILFIFHPIQLIVYNLMGWKAHQQVVHTMNGAIVNAFKLAGTQVSFANDFDIPEDKQLIIVANHQSLWDIIGIYWFMRKHYPLFVAKIELARGIPSISYNLRKSGAALIDRKNKKQAILEIVKFGTQVKKRKAAAVIFPEGTRSKDGQLKRFSIGGLTSLLKQMPESWIIPIVIKGTAAIEANKYYRIKMGKKVSWTVLKPFDASDKNPEAVLEQCHSQIKAALEQG